MASCAISLSDRCRKHAGIVAPEHLADIDRSKTSSEKLLGQQRQVAIIIEHGGASEAAHVGAETDVVDAHDFGHSGEPLGHIIEGREDRCRRPNADNPTRFRDHPRVLGEICRLCRPGAGDNEVCDRISARGGTLDEIVSAVGHVDNYPKPIARTHNHGAEICQTTLHRVFGLHVAQFIRSVVNQLQMTHAVGDTHFVDALYLALEKIGPFRCDDNRRLSGRRRAKHCGIADDVQLLLLCKPQQPTKGRPTPGVEFSRFRRTDRMNAPVRKNAMGWRIRNNGKASDGRPPARIDSATGSKAVLSRTKRPAWLCKSIVGAPVSSCRAVTVGPAPDDC